MKSFFGSFCSGWMQALRDYSCILEELNRQLGEQRGSPVVIVHGGIISQQGLFRRGELAESFGDNVHELTQFRLCRTFGNRKIRNIPDPEIGFQATRPAKRMDPASCPEKFAKAISGPVRPVGGFGQKLYWRKVPGSPTLFFRRSAFLQKSSFLTDFKRGQLMLCM